MFLENFFKKKNKDFSKIFIKSGNDRWALSFVASDMDLICSKLGIKRGKFPFLGKEKKSIYYLSRYVVEKLEKSENRIGIFYTHGYPNSSALDKNLFENIKKKTEIIDRIHVTHQLMENYMLETGISKKKIFKIPITITLENFSYVDDLKKRNMRNYLKIPLNKIVIGSFQKDAHGWGKGNEPKLIKGPDIFLKSLEILKNTYKNDLHVLLTGPARGYVKSGLEKLNISYSHFYVSNFKSIEKYYHALDLYLVTSREEGGPRMILESMACGIPLVSTKVGQATDLIKHGWNGWLIDIGDYEGIANQAKNVLEQRNSISKILVNGRTTAQKNSAISLVPMWKNFFEGFVNF